MAIEPELGDRKNRLREPIGYRKELIGYRKELIRYKEELVCYQGELIRYFRELIGYQGELIGCFGAFWECQFKRHHGAISLLSEQVLSWGHCMSFMDAPCVETLLHIQYGS